MPAKLANVKDPSLVKKDPTTMMPVGSRRNRPTYAKNGTAPTHDRENRRPPEGRAAEVEATLLNSGSRQETGCGHLATAQALAFEVCSPAGTTVGPSTRE